MKIYTGRGDYGHTNLIGGKTVHKDHPRVEAYGSLDELNALVGWIRATCEDQGLLNDLREDLLTIQHQLFDLGSHLADGQGKQDIRLDEQAVAWLESQIDRYQDACPPIKHFILPGGHPLAAMIQWARAVCRRCERMLVTVMRESEIDQVSYSYLNRLSDYFFVLGRYVNHCSGKKEDFYKSGGEVFHHD